MRCVFFFFEASYMLPKAQTQFQSTFPITDTDKHYVSLELVIIKQSIGFFPTSISDKLTRFFTGSVFLNNAHLPSSFFYVSTLPPTLSLSLPLIYAINHLSLQKHIVLFSVRGSWSPWSLPSLIPKWPTSSQLHIYAIAR